MVRKYVILIVFLFVGQLVFSQAKKPTIMVVPSDNWCVKNGYTMMYDEMGTLKTLPDYKMAVQNETDLLMTISKINTTLIVFFILNSTSYLYLNIPPHFLLKILFICLSVS